MVKMTRLSLICLLLPLVFQGTHMLGMLLSLSQECHSRSEEMWSRETDTDKDAFYNCAFRNSGACVCRDSG